MSACDWDKYRCFLKRALVFYRLLCLPCKFSSLFDLNLQQSFSGIYHLLYHQDFQWVLMAIPLSWDLNIMTFMSVFETCGKLFALRNLVFIGAYLFTVSLKYGGNSHHMKVNWDKWLTININMSNVHMKQCSYA